MKMREIQIDKNKKMKKKKEEIDDQATVAMSRVPPNPNLPEEVIEDILSRVPVKSLIRFRCVSKPWQNLLSSDSKFIKKHLNRTLENIENCRCHILSVKWSVYYLIRNESFENLKLLQNPTCIEGLMGLYMVGSANGLVCLESSKNIYIWNPATRQCKALPLPQLENIFGKIQHGFYFHPEMDDYKVVRLVTFQKQVDFRFIRLYTEVEVYSLRGDSWRRIEYNLRVMPHCFTWESGRAVVSGAVNWIGSRVGLFDGIIISFDMNDETFREVLLPSYFDPSPNDFGSLGVRDLRLRVFEGCLALVVSLKDCVTNVWVMKEYGVKQSWSQVFTMVNRQNIDYPIDLMQNGELLMAMNDENDESELYSYNSNSKDYKKIEIPAQRMNYDGYGRPCVDAVLPYVESLVLVD